MDDSKDDTQQTSYIDTFKRHLGRLRLPKTSRTVFAAVATAAVIGGGLTIVTAESTDSQSPAVAVADASHDSERAGRGNDRVAPSQEPSATPTEAKTAEKTDKPAPEPAKTKKPKPDWVLPSPAPISDDFGPRDWRAGEMHYGTDFAAAPGQTNYAAGAGVVVQAGPNGGYGNSVIIDHGNGIVTVYGHHTSVSVEVGDEVKAGDPIGKAGSTGDVTGPHLHFEVHIDTVAVDPVTFLKDHGVKP